MPASVIIPAYRAHGIVGRTVRAARAIPGIAEVIVVDDGSPDGTGEEAARAGADRVLYLATNRGKGGALRAGVEAAGHDPLLFLDADLGPSAAHAGALLDALGGRPAMAIAVLPSQPTGGGFGIARGVAGAAIRLLAGLKVAAPLSGQRALPAHLVRHVGLAPRFAVETALTIEAAHLGLPIIEVPVPLQHRVTGRTLPGFWHRLRQLKDIARFTALAAYGLGWPALSPAQVATRIALWLTALALLAALCGAISPSASRMITLCVAAALVAWLPSLWASAVSLRLRRANYLGRSLPAAAGLLFPLIAAPAAWFSALPRDTSRSAVMVILVLGAVGLLDDLLGHRGRARGLRGHLFSLLRGRLTTGVVKAAGGLGVGLAAGLVLDRGRPVLIALDALLIALTANLVNLLDLRPGRALKGFGVLCALGIALAPDLLHLLGPLLAVALVCAPAELSGRVMLGDVGANVLGGAAGLGLAISLPPWGRAGAVALWSVLHLLCERASLSGVISANRLLDLLDRIGTRHLPPLRSAQGISDGP